MDYTNCWELYKTHTESFQSDFDYYADLCKNKTTLELFAGYGRLTNYLKKYTDDIEAVEIQPEFAKLIDLPENKIHVTDVLNFKVPKKFQRIIAGFNSFCLIINDNNIHQLFRMIDHQLSHDGIVSLSYYDHHYWEGDYEEIFKFNGKDVLYKPTCDLSTQEEKIGTWVDRYFLNFQVFDYAFKTKLYDSIEQLLPFIQNTKLRIVETIKDYRKSDIFPGWIEFVLKKGA